MPGIGAGLPFGARGAQFPTRPDYDAATRTASGRAPAGSAVAVLLDGALAGTVSANADGRWWFAFGTAPGAGKTIAARTAITSPGRILASLHEALGPLTTSFTAGTPSGTPIAEITGLAAGETIATLTPGDGRLALDETGRRLVAGASAATAGSIAATLTTSAGRTLAMTLTVTAGGASYVARPLVVGTNFQPGGGPSAETTNLEQMVRLPFFLTGEADLASVKLSLANWY